MSKGEKSKENCIDTYVKERVNIEFKYLNQPWINNLIRRYKKKWLKYNYPQS